MATFTFNGSQSVTTPFNTAVDRVIFDLNAEDIVAITEDRSANTVTFTAATGAVLTLTQTNFAAIGASQPGALVPGVDSDILFDIGTRTADTGGTALLGNIVVGLEGGDTITGARVMGQDAGSPGGLLVGNQGMDTISNGDLFSVRMFGGQGNDSITLATNNGSDESLIVGGLGTDTIVVSGGGTGTNIGYQGSVTVFGGNEANDPADGRDIITVTLAGSGEALVAGNGGDDSITINALGGATVGGNATVFGGQGDDAIAATVSGGQFIGGLGTDTITVTSIGTGGNDFTVIGGNEANDPADGRDVITLNLLANDTALVTGNGGADSIIITSNTDAEFMVFGGQGNDTIAGNAGGTEAATVGDGSMIVGGLGSDVINVDLVNNTAGVGAPSVGSNVTILGGNGFSDATDGADRITVTLTGDARGSAAIEAQSADIFGNGGDDQIVLTGTGSATVHGGQGNDTISVDNGLYTLTGGQGADRFDFTASDGTAGINGTGTLVSTTVAADVSRITDLNFDEDELALGNDVQVVANLSGSETAGTNLSEAASRAFATATSTTAANIDAAVIFSYQGQQYLVSGTTDVTTGTAPNQVTADTIDALINITGFTGTIGVDDFVGTV